MKLFKVFVSAAVLVILTTSGGAFAAEVSDKTQSVSGGGVTAKVTLLTAKGNGDVRFQLVLDTHSVNLDKYDLKSIVVLRDDAGQSYAPLAVEATGGGHHREATLVFPKVARDAKRLELLITDVAGIKERTFRWDLQ